MFDCVIRLNGRPGKAATDPSNRLECNKFACAQQAEAEGGIKAWFLEAKGLLQTGFAEKKEFRQTFEPQVPRLIRFVNRIGDRVKLAMRYGNYAVLLQEMNRAEEAKQYAAKVEEIEAELAGKR